MSSSIAGNPKLDDSLSIGYFIYFWSLTSTVSTASSSAVRRRKNPTPRGGHPNLALVPPARNLSYKTLLDINQCQYALGYWVPLILAINRNPRELAIALNYGLFAGIVNGGANKVCI